MATTPTSTVSEAARKLLDEGFPKAWIFQDDGLEVEGEFLYLTSGMTEQYGRCPIAVISVDGVKRGVWLMHAALKSQLLAVKPKPGDIIAIRRDKTKTKAAASGMGYFNYAVANVSRPEQQNVDWNLLGDPNKATHESPTSSDEPSEGNDEDIPF